MTDKNEANLPDDELRQLWRGVSGPHAELTGPLIRYAGLVYAAVRSACESEKNWLRAQRDVAEQKAAENTPPIQIDPALHAVFTHHGIASYQLPSLVTDIIHWAAQACRQSQSEQLAAAQATITALSQQLQKLKETK